MPCTSLLEPWNTPISSASSLVIESIEADGYLSIKLRATIYKRVLLICFSFLNYQWYQIKKFSPSYNAKLGRTQIHENFLETDADAGLILNLKALQTALTGPQNCILSTLPYSSIHFVFIEDNSEIEVISTKKPSITLLGKGPLSRVI